MTIVETVNNIYTMTFYNRKKELANAIIKGKPFFDWLNRKGAIGDKPAGLAIEYPVSLAKNTTAAFLGRGSTIGISDTEFAKLARYDWKYCGVSVVRYRVDDVKQSAAEHVLIDAVNAKIDNARDSLLELLEERLMSTSGNVDEPEGLNTVVSTTPETGVLGGLDRAVYPGWRNQKKTASGVATTYLLPDLRTLYNDCSKGPGGPPDFHLTDQTTFELYESELVEATRLVNMELKDLGYTGMTYKGSPLEWSEFCPQGYWYMLNTKALFLCISSSGLLEMTKWKEPTNQVGDSVAQIYATLALTTNAPRKLGVLSGIHA